MIHCLHCGIDTPRLTLDQRYCPPCARRVAELAVEDAKRQTAHARFSVAKPLTRWGVA